MIFKLFIRMSCLLCSLVWSQMAEANHVNGHVQNAMGKPLVGVSVYVQGTTYGAVTNVKGYYALELPVGQHELVFRLLGYKTLTKTINLQTSHKVVNIILQDDQQQLNAITIRPGDEDPAYAIIRNAQKNRKKHLYSFETAQCVTYSKLTLEKELNRPSIDSLNDSLYLNLEIDKEQMELIEGKARAYFASPDKVKQEYYAYLDHSKTGRRRNFGQTFEVSQTFEPKTDKYSPPLMGEGGGYIFYEHIADADFNFYQNRLNIPALAKRPLVSPIGGGALLAYDYEWLTSFIEDGKLVHKISVIPKRENGAFVKGLIFITDDEYAIKAVDLEVHPKALNLYKAFRLIQNYKQIDSAWVLTREELFYHTKAEGEIKMGNTLVLYEDWQINPDFARNTFNGATVAYTKDAMTMGAEFWGQERPITMNQVESQFIQEQDSTRNYLKSPEYLHKADSSYNHTGIWDFLLTGVGKQNSFKGTRWSILPLIAQPRFFAVGGYRHAIGGSFDKEFDSGHNLDLYAQVDYGFLNNDLRGHGRVGFRYNPKKMARLWVRGGSEYEILNDFESIAATFSRSNYLLSNHFTVGHEIEIRNGLFLDAMVRYSEQKSIEDVQLSDWSNTLWESSGLNDPQPFDNYNKLLLEYTVSIRFKQQYEMRPNRKIIRGSDYPKINITHKWGIPQVLNSEIDFHYVSVHIWDDFGWGTGGLSKYNIKAGSFLHSGDTRFVDNQFFRGSDRFFFSNPLLSLQLLGRSVNTQGPFLHGNYIHHFNGALLGKMPLLKHTRLQASFGGACLFDRGTGIAHVEAFGGLEYPFKIGQQVMKFGTYYIQAYSNHTKADYTVKVGLNFLNTYSGRWLY